MAEEVHQRKALEVLIQNLREESKAGEQKITEIAKQELVKAVEENQYLSKQISQLEYENESFRTKADNDKEYIENLIKKLKSLEEENKILADMATPSTNQHFSKESFDLEEWQAKVKQLERYVCSPTCF
jgi:predicted RNase H-like nuclease (RuvC/YqgF family)